MTKTWRPNGWENPFNPAAFYHHKDFEVHDAFEAGADAILEALRASRLPEDIKLAIKRMRFIDWERPSGQVVFIPDEPTLEGGKNGNF